MGDGTVSIRINGRRKKAPKGKTILEVARESGIEIPTLCYHEALTPEGSCRLCVVEVKQGRSVRTAASCVTPVEEGMVIRTDTEKIREIRRMIVTLLLARCPGVEIIKRTARELGVRSNPFEKGEEECFLCGMCGFAYRGPSSEVEPPFGQESNVCIGCGTCTTICPARTFDLEKVFARRSMHKAGGKEGIGRCIICETYYTGT
jgi:predicted molibdopterin-dependent oxidoreductase YjgC